MLYSFEDFSLDTARRELRRNGSLIALQPQVFDLLEYAIRNRDRVVTKDELLAAVWNGRLVSELTMNTRINAARSGIGDSGEEQRLLRTVYGKGIRFVGAVCEEAETVRKLAAISQPVVAPRLSIIVLPFTNLGSDPNQQYFADGITEDLTTDLSRLADLFVISRNTAFTYRNKPIDAKQIGRELGVRYVLEGSVRRSGNQVRVNAQLIDAATAAHLWAERFDGDAGDLFALQDEITSRIAVALDLELVGAEAARATEHPETQDYILRGRAARLKPPSHENRAEAIDQFEQALALDQGSVAAQSWLSIALMARVLDNMAGTAAADILRAEDLAERALATLPRSSLAHFAKGQVLRALDRYGEAILEYETAVALNRNWADAYSNLGWCKFMIGSIEELIPAQEQAIRLSPRDPQIGLFRPDRARPIAAITPRRGDHLVRKGA